MGMNLGPQQGNVIFSKKVLVSDLPHTDNVATSITQFYRIFNWFGMSSLFVHLFIFTNASLYIPGRTNPLTGLPDCVLGLTAGLYPAVFPPVSGFFRLVPRNQ